MNSGAPPPSITAAPGSSAILECPREHQGSMLLLFTAHSIILSAGGRLISWKYFATSLISPPPRPSSSHAGYLSREHFQLSNLLQSESEHKKTSPHAVSLTLSGMWLRLKRAPALRVMFYGFTSHVMVEKLIICFSSFFFFFIVVLSDARENKKKQSPDEKESGCSGSLFQPA